MRQLVGRRKEVAPLCDEKAQHSSYELVSRPFAPVSYDERPSPVSYTYERPSPVSYAYEFSLSVC